MNPEELSRAIVLYTGRGGGSPFPTRSLERLAQYFDVLEAADLANEIAHLEEEFYEVQPTDLESLNESADRAAAVFASRHPELTEEAVDALRWCYTYDWK